jgi:hypothetical protein
VTKILSVVGARAEDGPSPSAAADANFVGPISLPPRQTIVTGHFDFDDACLQFERFMESDDSDLAIRGLLHENPRLLCFLLRRASPSVIQTRPSIAAPYSFDAFALHIPQWTERTLFKFGSVTSPPFGLNGAWSEELVDAAGTIVGWVHKGDQRAFGKLADDLARSFQSEWPSHSGYDSFQRLLSSAWCADRTTFVLLFGRHKVIDERSRSSLHRGGQETIELRSYDSILRALYSRCPSVRLPEPVVVASFRVHRGEEGSFVVRSEILEEVNQKLLALLGKSPAENDSARVVSLSLRVRGNLEDVPFTHSDDGYKRVSARDINELAMGISDNNPDRWTGDGWHHPSGYKEIVTPATLRQGLSVRYNAPSVDTSINLDFIVDEVRYRERGARPIDPFAI